jgi:hypothetical protein
MIPRLDEETDTTGRRHVTEKRYEKLIGDGTCENPQTIIRWNGREFGHVRAPSHDLLAARVDRVQGAWAVIDAMLAKLYGDLSEDERLAWYEEHAEDLVEITVGADGRRAFTQNKSVYRWSDRMRFRGILERLDTEVVPELQRLARDREP